MCASSFPTRRTAFSIPATYADKKNVLILALFLLFIKQKSFM